MLIVLWRGLKLWKRIGGGGECHNCRADMVRKINGEINEAQMENVQDELDHCNQ